MVSVETILEEARAKILAFENTVWAEHELESPKELFHYTTIEGLVGILSDCHLFLSDILASNDRSEFVHGAQMIVSECRKRSAHVLLANLAEVFQPDQRSGLGRSWFIHAACFCTGSDVLTQWRGYSFAGGFAIGLDFEKLMKEARATNAFAIVRMLYHQDLQEKIISETLDTVVRLFDEWLMPMLNKLSKQDRQRASDGFFLEVGSSLLKSIARFKNPAFQSEDEWRIFSFDSSEVVQEKVKFRTRSNSILPYIELPFPADIVSSVYRSPGVWPASVEYSLQRLVMSVGEHIEIKKSEIPL
ncbi:MAG TPA: DUF2971 domain-containing protein [Bryobacteraceae bacterium]|jgi:hypothetical protein|nr:DUF2971 domain-containing protein [Bryobacteraceae bacterium]